jgi:4-diphosphocytidyl-2-C-methyl-D-erythritol kinase
MAAAEIRAQAKINLFLHVTGREASGYHTLSTLFCRIDLADVVRVRLTPSSRSLDCTGPELPPQGLGSVAENLAWRAAIAYADAARWPSGFEIEVEKHIPVSGGLGGGSADAGAVLRALNALNTRPLADAKLQQLACALGADVPFLTQRATPLAVASGRGDDWRAIAPLPERVCILVVPKVGVSTKDAYSWIDEERGWTRREIRPRTSGDVPPLDTWDDVRRVAHNDFESVVFPRVPEVAAAWGQLADDVRDLDAIVRMSGSGASVYAVVARDVPRRPGSSTVKTLLTRTSGRVESVLLTD